MLHGTMYLFNTLLIRLVNKIPRTGGRRRILLALRHFPSRVGVENPYGRFGSCVVLSLVVSGESGQEFWQPPGITTEV